MESAPTNNTLGSNLRDARNRRDYSQQDVADLTGMSRSHVAGLESGRSSNPGVLTVYRLSKVLGVRMETVLELPPLNDEA